ncbi:MAG: alkyl sulfatase dimerization domain-containing protein [Acidimicrobiales bacterium]
MTTNFMAYTDAVWNGSSSLDLYRSEQLAEQGLVEVAPHVQFWPAVSNVTAVQSEDGLVLLDTGRATSAEHLFSLLRGWTRSRLHTATFSHGHLDHIFGVGPFDQESRERGWASPVVIAHEAIRDRFARYVTTAGYCGIVKQRQFQMPTPAWPTSYRYPDITYRDQLTVEVGDVGMHLFHARGETDDHTYVWLPEPKIICTGDLFIWGCPNAGNPQKVQRYPVEWARALRHMSTLNAEILLPGHGVPIFGQDRIRQALGDTASFLESLTSQVLELMNQGYRLNDIVHEVRPPADLAQLPYLAPCYDEHEFIVRNLWRFYGGWYDGNPAELKPAPSKTLAATIAELCGGVDTLVGKALELSDQGEFRLASHLVEMAFLAEPDRNDVHAARASVYDHRADAETSTMARGIFCSAAAESRAAVNGTDFAAEIVKSPEGRLAARGVQVVGTLEDPEMAS